MAVVKGGEEGRGGGGEDEGREVNPEWRKKTKKMKEEEEEEQEGEEGEEEG